MTKTQTKQLLFNLFLFRTKYENTGKILTKFLKDKDAQILTVSRNGEDYYNKDFKRQFGNSSSKGYLQYELDRKLSGVLTRLKKDFPYFSTADIAIFCYSAAGFQDYLIARFANISSSKRVSARRTQLMELLKQSDREWREIYLAMLSTALTYHKRGRNQDLA